VVKFQSVLAWWSGLQVHLRVLATNLGGHRRYGDNPGNTWVHGHHDGEHLEPPATSLGAGTHLGAPMWSLEASTTSLGALWITVEQSGKHYILFGNLACMSGNHSYYLWFNNFYNWCIQFVFSSMNFCSYPSTLGMSVQAAGGTWGQFLEHQRMPIKCTQICTPRSLSSDIGEALQGHGSTNLEAIKRKLGDTLRDSDHPSLGMHWEAVIQWVWRSPHGGEDHANLEAVMERALRCTRRPWLC